jgi:hypothetical protein
MAKMTIGSIQSNVATLGGGVLSIDVTISSVTTTQSIIRINGSKWNSGSTNAESRVVQAVGYFVNSTTLRIVRATSGPSIDVRWEVIYYSSGVSVVHGFLSDWSGTNNITISAIDQSKTFLITTFSGDQGTAGLPAAQCYFSSTTNLRIVTQSSTYWNGRAQYQIVTIDDASVQYNTGALDTDAETSITLGSSVDTTKTFIEASWHYTTNDLSALGYDSSMWLLSNANTLLFQRNRTSAANAVNYSYFVVSIGGTSSIKVQRGSASFGASATNVPTISSVDTTKTQSKLCHIGGLLQCATTTAQPIYSYAHGYISDATHVTLTKGDATNRTDILSWELIEETVGSTSSKVPQIFMFYTRLRSN